MLREAQSHGLVVPPIRLFTLVVPPEGPMEVVSPGKTLWGAAGDGEPGGRELLLDLPWGCVASSPWCCFGHKGSGTAVPVPLSTTGHAAGDVSGSGRAQNCVSASQRNLCFCFLFVVFSPLSPVQPGRLSSSCSVTPRSHQTLEARIREQQ